MEDLKIQKKIAIDSNLKSWKLSPRQICDLELLLNGGFAPLNGFLNLADYVSVINNLTLDNGVIWPMPIMLDITAEFAKSLKDAEKIYLTDSEGVHLAILEIENIWQPDKGLEAQRVFGTQDATHPGVDFLFNKTNDYYIGGKVIGLEMPRHFDFNDLRLTPAQLKAEFTALGWKRVVGFQTRNPLHRAHQELTLRAAKDYNAKILLHPVVGMTKPGDIDHYTRVRCYKKILDHYPQDSIKLSLLALAMRMAGPREALWHALIRKNYGCTHFIVGRDHAGPGKDKNGKDFYGPYDAQELVAKYQDKIGIEIIPFNEMVYSKSTKSYLPIDKVQDKDDILNISGTEFRRKLQNNDEIPEWFSYADIIQELKKSYKPENKKGVTIFFTGLSGAGKSTIAKALQAKLLEDGNRTVTLLDGDEVRNHLSSELNFSKEHRDLNILRIGYVASEITKHGGIAICAPIAPYAATRKKVRDMVEQYGKFIEVYVNTPLEVCEERDRKGLYKKARAGEILNFTGINDPYEEPDKSEIRLCSKTQSDIDNFYTLIIQLLDAL